MKGGGYFIFLAILLSSCAFDLVHVKQIPTQIESTHLSKGPFKLAKEVNVSLGTGYSRNLKQGTKWNYVGTIWSEPHWLDSHWAEIRMLPGWLN